MCSKNENSLLYIRAIQGHTGGKLIELELLGHVAFPYNWKEFMFHRGSSFDCTSILKSGLCAGGKRRTDGRQTVFFAPLNPMVENDPEEELPSDDFTKPRKEHYRSKWKHSQDAVYWVNLARAQDKGFQFWQTRSNAIVEHSSVPSDCIYKVISLNGERVFIRETRDASNSTKSCTRKFLENAAAATAAASVRGWEESSKMLVKEELKENPGISTEDSETSRNRKLLRSDVSNINLLKKSMNVKSTSELKELLTMYS